MAFAEEIAGRLVAQGVGTLGTTIFLSSAAEIPPGDGPYLSVIETGGTRPMRTHDAVAVPAYPQPGASIVARGRDAALARALAGTAYAALAGVRNAVVGGGRRYLEIDIRQEPMDIGLDTAGRARFAFNIATIVASS